MSRLHCFLSTLRMASCHAAPGCAFHGSQGKARITAGQSLAIECRDDGDSSVEPTGESAQQHPFGVHCLELCQIPSWSLLLHFDSFLLQPGFLLKQSGWGPVLSSLSWHTWALRVMETGGMRWWEWCYLDRVVSPSYTRTSFSSLPALKFCGSVTTNQFEFYMAIIISLQFWGISKYMGWYTSGILKLVDQWGSCWGKFRAYSAKVSSYFQTRGLEYAKQTNNILTV